MANTELPDKIGVKEVTVDATEAFLDEDYVSSDEEVRISQQVLVM